MRLKKTTCYITALFALTIAFTACKSSQSGGRKRLTVITYEKKRGARTTSPSQKHYSARKKKRDETYFDFEEQETRKSSSSGNRRNSSASAEAQKVIRVARSYMGTPYKYGGTTRRGMDCSGLLCTTFEAVNIKLPRPSYEQAEYGKEISLRNIRPGDLVFFSEKKGGNRVSHAGIVTAIEGPENVRFIHSSTSRGVVEDNLYTDYYRKIFVKAVRPF